MPEIVPEVVILGIAPIVVFLVGAIKAARPGMREATAPLVTVGVAVALATMLYVAGFVDTQGLTVAQVVARAVLAGFSIAMAASGGRSWVQQAQARRDSWAERAQARRHGDDGGDA